MLPSASRLRRRTDFAAAVRRGRRAGRTRLVVHFDHELDPAATTAPAAAPGAGCGSASSLAPAAAPVLAGFVVSKAVGGAVVRNRVRRQLRHLVASRISSLPAGTRLVVRALAPAAGASSVALAADLDAALARAQRVTTTPKKSQVNAS